jgi:hypothetical protein
MFDAYNVADTYSTSDWALTKRPDTLFINGKTYSCDKYWVGDVGGGTVWISNGVPMPVNRVQGPGWLFLDI